MIDIDPRILLLVIPLAALQIILLLVALWDWLKQGMSLKSRYIWLVIVLFIGIIGPVFYFLVAPRNTSELDIEDNQ